MPKQDSSWIGLVGLAVMGQNLALNIARRGFSIAVFNRTPAKTDAFLKRVKDEPVVGARTIDAFVGGLSRPRRIILMVQAGAGVDDTVRQLLPLLAPGDLLIDAGNSHPDDSARRSAEIEKHGIRFMGMGVSGGEEGALNGPSLMPGGSREAYAEIAPMLQQIAARTADGPCVTYVGAGAAGHFVKMVHNGIEYADMQLIAEAYDLLGSALNMGPADQAAAFAEWNRGPLESYLIEITAAVLTKIDPATGKPMVDVILDRAGQKGTGQWTAEIALRLGVPLPTLHAAVDARGLSAKLALRRRAATRLRGPSPAAAADRRLVKDVGNALYAGKIASYAQGMDLLRVASEQYGFGLDLAEIARIWKGGCIIRARLLDRIRTAFQRDPALDNLLLDPEFATWTSEHQPAWRRVVGLAAECGVPALALGTSLAYYDSLRRTRLPQNLTQAQRDYFGAHTYERVDKPEGEKFHSEWSKL